MKVGAVDVGATAGERTARLPLGSLQSGEASRVLRALMPTWEAVRESTRRPRQRWCVSWEFRKRRHLLVLEWPGQEVGWRSFAEEGNKQILKDRMKRG